MSATKDNVLKDANGQRKTLADYGATYVSDEWLAERGLTVVDKNYQAPISAETLKKQRYDAINSEYIAKRDKLLLARMALVAAGSATTNIDEAINTLMAEWKTALLAVEGGA